MKTITIEKESQHNAIVSKSGTKINKRPFVAEFVLNKKKVEKDYLRPSFTQFLGGKDCEPEEDQRRYTWEAPQNTPLAIGSCMSYNEFTVDEGMFVDGVWQPMTFAEIVKYLQAEQLNQRQAKQDFPERETAFNGNVELDFL